MIHSTILYNCGWKDGLHLADSKARLSSHDPYRFSPPSNLQDMDHPSARTVGWQGGMICEDSGGKHEEGLLYARGIGMRDCLHTSVLQSINQWDHSDFPHEPISFPGIPNGTASVQARWCNPTKLSSQDNMYMCVFVFVCVWSLSVECLSMESAK
jgi:hypothetical protein